MTNEEAINHLQDISNEIDDIFIFTADEKHEALNKAIDLLRHKVALENKLTEMRTEWFRGEA